MARAAAFLMWMMDLQQAGWGAATPPRGSPWPDSSDGVHTILVGDATTTAAEIQQLVTHGAPPDFVWGGSPEHIAQWKQIHPAVVITDYVSFAFDPTTNNRTWWETNHPSWIMYRCDRKTPALKCYPPAPCDSEMPLDITNPAVVQFQIEHGVLPAKAQGYSGIAWDNFDLDNGMKACGHYSAAGKWVQQYDGTNTTISAAGKAQWAKDVVEWTRAMAAESRKVDMLMVPNWGGLVESSRTDRMWNASIIMGVANGTDGCLDEGGFVGFHGYGPGASVKVGAEWENTVRFALNLQRSGKSYYSINQWGYGDAATPGAWPPPQHVTIPVAVHAWVLASFLLSNTAASGTTLVCTQCYGHGAVNFSWWPEDAAKVGKPTGDPIKLASGVWSRSFEHALAYANPWPSRTVVQLPTDGGPWREVLGQDELLHSGGTTLILNASQAAVLMRTGSAQLKTDDRGVRPSVLFCTPHGLFHSERTWVDLVYLRSLHNSSAAGGGFEVDWTETLGNITRARIFQYNAIVLFISPDSGAVIPPVGSPAFRADFAGVILDYVRAGGGLLLFPTETNQYAQQLFSLTSALGAKLPVERLLETTAENVAVLEHMTSEGDSVKIFWTDRIHTDTSAPQLTAGVKSIWYPSMPAYNAAHGGPIAVDDNWTVVLRGSQTSHTTPVNLSASVSMPLPPANQIFQRPTPVVSPPLFAVRQLGKGRVGLLNQWRHYTTGSGSAWLFDSQVLSTGANGRPSDMGQLLLNTFHWLAQPTVVGVGRFVTPAGHLDDPNSKESALKDFPELHVGYDVDTLANDPADPSLKLRRGIIGIRTTFSTGTDNVASIAQTARAHDLDFVIILEEFDSGKGSNSARLTNATLMQLAAECTTHSADDLALFPGYTIRDNIGSKLFVWGPTSAVMHMFPRPDVLTPDGSRILVQPTDPNNASRL